MPVKPAAEPHTFDRTVRRMGLSAISELLGHGPTIKRRGPRRKGRVTNVEELESDDFPDYWTHCLSDLHAAYGGICSYLCVYIDRFFGGCTVDHYRPKTLYPHLAYEWSNYRLACLRMNSSKNNDDGIVDPFEVREGWFQLDLVSFEVYANPALPDELMRRVEHTIDKLGLAKYDCCRIREQYYLDYSAGHISWAYLERMCPIVAGELLRRGLSRSIVKVEESPPNSGEGEGVTPV